ncbi:DJ-1 domain InhA-type [Penicillium chermesinum]|uniref:DJ-1 domain InhA-type n=1 Tax=Penicillium chermesinum TaxID=63820 RepID=A0A9W9NHT4_9EURO|nr:DJ-1 domain InhA-type [Penicillium chermesinum]KAJ5220063.1 DJ-1 domain InhA-type [Penicillium chermesinum]
MPSDTLHIGVLLLPDSQLLDVAPVDLLFMLNPDYLASLGLPKPIVDLGQPCKISYIGLDEANKPMNLTSFISVSVTHTISDSEVGVGSLDIILIPGPPPSTMPPAQEWITFIQAHNAAGTTILSICTGALVVAHAGIAAGKLATAPRFLVPRLKKEFPEAKLWDDMARVTCDGNLWMSAGITNGHDLVAAYLRQNYPAPVVNAILAIADIAPRPVKFASKPMTDNAWMLLQVITAIPYRLIRFLKGG